MARRELENIDKLIIVSHSKSKRSRGRLPTRWVDVVKVVVEGVSKRRFEWPKYVKHGDH